MRSNLQEQHAAEEFKAEEEIKEKQIVIRLPKHSLASVVLLIISYIEDKFVLDGSLDMETVFGMA